MEGDFLWDCAFVETNKDRLWIIPDKNDFFCDPTVEAHEDYLEYQIGKFKIENKRFADIVNVLENKGDGVFDTIGGEVWEASLLLSAYLILNKEKYIDNHSDFLELGAGVGLPSHLIKNLKLNSMFCKNDKIVISDNNKLLLRNLKHSIEDQLPLHKSDPQLTLAVAYLDWAKFLDYSDDTWLIKELRNDQFDYIIGSALCYAPYHKCLIEVIKYYLSGRCREIVILQIRDREGFQDLIEIIKTAGLNYMLEELDSSILDLSNMISKFSIDELKLKAQDMNFHFLKSTENTQYYSYQIPLSSDHCPLAIPGGKKHLITTSIQSFVILKIFNN